MMMTTIKVMMMPGHKIDFPISCTAMSSRCHDDDDDEYDYDDDDDDDNETIIMMMMPGH